MSSKESKYELSHVIKDKSTALSKIDILVQVCGLRALQNLQVLKVYGSSGFEGCLFSNCLSSV
jgi:hypothetical protein